jgi:hypothetical protein
MHFTLSTWPQAAAVALAAAIASTAILRILLATGLAWRLATDIPNDRSLHTLPTPRVGGWGIVPVCVVALLALAPHLWLIAAAAAGLAAMSQIDDRRGLPARVRFSAHLAAVVALLAVYPADAPWWLLAGIGFVMVWLTNLYNFMDGADGLAGGMALFGFGAYAIAALGGPGPSPDLVVAGAAISGAALGFLLLNFHPARLFLGDAGSIRSDSSPVPSAIGAGEGTCGRSGFRARLRSLYCGCICNTFETIVTRRKVLAGPSGALLSEDGPRGRRSSPDRSLLVPHHARRHNRCSVGEGPPGTAAVAGVLRMVRRPGMSRTLDRHALAPVSVGCRK